MEFLAESPQSVVEASPPRAQKRSGPRSRKGCWTCRRRRVKCNEQRPICRHCDRLQLECDYSTRPKLADRRKLERQKRESLQGTEVHHEATDAENDTFASAGNSQLVRFMRREPDDLDLVNLVPPVTGNCSLDLIALDHEAIRYFRTSFSEFYHTKNPKFSMYSIMSKIAEVSPMVMHMVLALGIQEMDIRRPQSNLLRSRTPTEHYAAALRMMKEQISLYGRLSDPDILFTTLFLMLVYEEKFGDGRCQGLMHHLTGAASIILHRGKEMLRLPGPSLESKSRGHALVKRSPNPDQQQLSLYSARILVWLTLHDSAAAAWNMGGTYSRTLHQSLNSETATLDLCEPAAGQHLEALRRLDRYSNPLYRTMWGEDYPQTELVDDVENRNIFALLGQCCQLRLMIAQLVTLSATNPKAAMEQVSAVAYGIDQVGYSFSELMEVASELSIDTDNSHRLVNNIREIVPFYYAAVLEFMRFTRFDQPLGSRQRHALRELMNLAFQGHKHSGDQAMTKVSWPLFVGAIETDDLVHRDWILSRFQEISKYGKNFERAYRFLLDVVSTQGQLGARVDLRQRMKSGDFEYFVLSR